MESVKLPPGYSVGNEINDGREVWSVFFKGMRLCCRPALSEALAAADGHYAERKFFNFQNLDLENGAWSARKLVPTRREP